MQTGRMEKSANYIKVRYDQEGNYGEVVVCSVQITHMEAGTTNPVDITTDMSEPKKTKIDEVQGDNNNVDTSTGTNVVPYHAFCQVYVVASTRMDHPLDFSSLSHDLLPRMGGHLAA